MHLHPLIQDLALILISASIVTIVFKWLKQPVVLGYIAVGVLVGTEIPIFPDVQDRANVELWAEIGIIFLLFALGLEFSFKKLLAVGRSAVATALCVLFGMMFLGFSVGHAMNWSTIDSLFLGGMLSMSSTTIIIKAFDDMKLKKHRFTQVVFGVLVVEDLIAILLMVLLSSVAVSHSFEGVELMGDLLKLLFMLVGWLLTGLIVIPTLLRKFKSYLNSETLLVVSLGLCLGMVVLANWVGFSSALGAFIMGSILAETSELPRIEKLIHPVKDLFGAIFFVSVGLLVDVAMIQEYWLPIVLLVGVVMLGQILFSFLGMVFSGQTLRTSVQAAFCLAQIGEFAFIIATMGRQLNVTSHFLYPIAVAVSVFTTFTTPFMIRLGPAMAQSLEARIPSGMLQLLNRLHKEESRVNNEDELRKYVRKSLKAIAFYVLILSGLTWTNVTYVLPFVSQYLVPSKADLLALGVGFLAFLPAIWGLMFRHLYGKEFVRVWNNANYRNGVSLSLLLLRTVIALFFLSMLFISIYSFGKGLLLFVVVACVILLLSYRPLKRRYLYLEKSFVDNLDETKRNMVTRNIESTDLYLATMTVSPNSELTGRYLYKAEFRKNYGINIVSIDRGQMRINIPGRKDQLFPYDVVTVVGNEQQLVQFTALIEMNGHVEGDDENRVEIKLKQVVIESLSSLTWKSIGESGIRENGNCLIVVMEREDGTVVSPEPSTVLMPNDRLWLTGEPANLQMVIDACCSADVHLTK